MRCEKTFIYVFSEEMQTIGNYPNYSTIWHILFMRIVSEMFKNWQGLSRRG
jgi:hypothetical protein